MQKKQFHVLTIEAGEVSPVKQGAVEGGKGDVEEQIGAVGRVSDGVGEQVHLQQGLDQIAQHLAAQRNLHSPLWSHCLSLTLYLPFKSLSLSTVELLYLLYLVFRRVKENVLLIPN